MHVEVSRSKVHQKPLVTFRFNGNTCAFSFLELKFGVCCLFSVSNKQTSKDSLETVCFKFVFADTMPKGHR